MGVGASDENEKESGIDSESDDSGNDDVTGTSLNAYSAKSPNSPNDVILRRPKKTSSTNPHEIVTQLAKRQSFQHVDFLADDIDAFIASVTVPPPPKDETVSSVPTPRKEDLRTSVGFKLLPDLPSILKTKPVPPVAAKPPSGAAAAKHAASKPSCRSTTAVVKDHRYRIMG